ncbi:D-amino acid dehydrogenase 1 [Saezia sanguinis]|uniref:D-amino acid dehydrogenase 1 n=1 Tax=Saezia sanguinis TaxID=1965230 RepID=A0A433SFU8_9BURK|nr:FAD-dependent oxidoreductase [Saezia sanguinis]RUS67590.1 D-amino acid dehydrogenase 1 [Saezia sanguinis]
MEKNITVLGAGMVGVCCALALQRLGARVTLIDRGELGNETSYGNAGVIARSSLIPFNNPALWKSLPRYSLNQSAQLRYNLGFMMRNWTWAVQYLSNTRKSRFKKTVVALNSLISLSSELHQAWVKEAGAEKHLHDQGWIHLYRTEAAFAGQAWARRIYEQYDVAFEVLDSAGLYMLEPSIKSIFERAVWIKDTMSISNPRAVVKAYARLFTAQGGSIVRSDVRHVSKAGNGHWVLQEVTGLQREAPCLVVALGPWSADMLLPLGVRIPMVYERGYHMHYQVADDVALNRPVYDTGGGYVLTPMEEGIRLSTGVELNDYNAPAMTEQLDMAQQFAQQAFPLGARKDQKPWLGSRPTLPDCRPMIGAVPDHAGLWLAVGHHHIGLNTGPATGQLLAALMSGEEPPIDPQPFAPERYL